ncbi:MAG: hypothetical protein OEV08_13825 [Nitrospira sp.]|nr:hypothetical protein [Nitrospira sp.]
MSIHRPICFQLICSAVDVVEPDAFRMLVMQDFDRVAVEDGDDGAGKGEGFTDADESE